MKLRICLNNTLPGQTLLEALLAISVILIGVISLISLLIQMRITSAETINEAYATQLGREAIEAARYVRDSNWLKIENGENVTFDTGLRHATAADYTAIYTWNPDSTDPDVALQFDFIPNDMSNNVTMVYSDDQGYWRQTTDADVVAGWQTTLFRRFVSFYPICFNTDTETERLLTADNQTCASNEGLVGIQVRVQVDWKNHGQISSRVFEDRLYNWKYANPDLIP